MTAAGSVSGVVDSWFGLLIIRCLRASSGREPELELRQVPTTEHRAVRWGSHARAARPSYDAMERIPIQSGSGAAKDGGWVSRACPHCSLGSELCLRASPEAQRFF